MRFSFSVLLYALRDSTQLDLAIRGVISTEVVINTSCADLINVVGLKYAHKNFSTKFTNV